MCPLPTGLSPTFPVVFEANLNNARIPALVQALRDGVYLQSKMTQQVEIQVIGLQALFETQAEM